MAVDRSVALAAQRMLLQAATGGRGAPRDNPFRFVAGTAVGDVAVDVVSAGVAEVSGAPVPGQAARILPLTVCGRELVVRAVLARKGGAWAVREIDAVPYVVPGRPRETLDEAGTRAAKSALAAALEPVLERERRRFLERELTDIFAGRATRESEIKRVRDEIERRREKLRRLVRERDAAAGAGEARAAELRAELASLADPEVAGSSAACQASD